MTSITVNKRFYDLKAHKWREAGETFAAEEKRAEQILSRLPGRVVVSEGPRHVETVPDLSSMTVAQLKTLASERGVEIPKGARKADIIRELGG